MSTITVQTISNGSVSTSSANVISGSAKAWVNFNGTGTVAIRASYNVSSITDNGTGDYTVNFTNALADANYSSVGQSLFASGVIGVICENQFNALKTTSSYRISGVNVIGTGAVDLNTIMLAIFR